MALIYKFFCVPIERDKNQFSDLRLATLFHVNLINFEVITEKLSMNCDPTKS